MYTIKDFEDAISTHKLVTTTEYYDRIFLSASTRKDLLDEYSKSNSGSSNFTFYSGLFLYKHGNVQIEIGDSPTCGFFVADNEIVIQISDYSSTGRRESVLMNTPVPYSYGTPNPYYGPTSGNYVVNHPQLQSQYKYFNTGVLINLLDLDNYVAEPYPVPKCDCGAKSVGSNLHSNWCTLS